MLARFSYVRLSLSCGLYCLDHSLRPTFTPQLYARPHQHHLDASTDCNPPAVMFHGDQLLVQFGRRVLTGARA